MNRGATLVFLVLKGKGRRVDPDNSPQIPL